ncbi:LysR family transcriptional regulator [Paracoccus sp. Ld10]|uniref:helix-turn-helix domain-containing protein n=1 Tax=Paracoccus sp. Ld10 TaxID=649158 RepID=UPI003862E288
MLNATWIETFAVLAEEGHFTRAAQRLNMTRPTPPAHRRRPDRPGRAVPGGSVKLHRQGQLH